MQAWIEAQQERSQINKERFEKFKSNLFWFGRWFSCGRSSIFFYIVGMSIFAMLGFLGGINTPSSIACKKVKSACHFMRLDKTQVVLPHQAKQLIEEYEKSKFKPRRYRRK
ncbi:hypothetical protein LC593_30165 [Nostoc sp. CHAB 5844]|nr:hypothetical protein [Nostoc sp. CHAB 5844]